MFITTCLFTFIFTLIFETREAQFLGNVSRSPVSERMARILTGSNPIPRSSLVEHLTSLGRIVGTIERSDSKPQQIASTFTTYYAFRGIPYAEPPIGALRWSEPVQETDRWPNDRLDATNYRPFCPQFDHDREDVVGQEDCLYLNIFTPKLPGAGGGRDRIPVLVFLHGGSYTRGASSSHGPRILMRENIVLVTLNYRLGVLGLLSTGDDVIPGNYAALDQVAALTWVRNHIEDFGGDPDAITLGGFSAGASYVHLHMLSPLSKGLFHKSILMSGSANCVWSVQNAPSKIALEFASDVGCPISSSEEIKQCLQLKDVNSLLNVQAKRSRYVYWPFEFRPVVDFGMRENHFLSNSVSEMHKNPLATSVPVLMGGTPEEGILFALTVLLFSDDNSSPNEVYESASKYLVQSLWPNDSSAQHVADVAQSFYYSKNSKSDLNTLVAEMTDALTDLLFTSCIWDAAASFASFQVPVYTYLMTHHDDNSPSFGAPLYRLSRSLGVTSPLLSHGVSHGDDVILMFDFPFDLGDPSSRDKQMSNVITTAVGNFVKKGTPQSQTTSQFLSWDPLKPGDPAYYYKLSLNPAMIHKPYRYKERNMWLQSIPELEGTFSSYESNLNWQIGCLVLLGILLILLAIICCCGAYKFHSRHRVKYPSSGATLRSSLSSTLASATSREG